MRRWCNCTFSGTCIALLVSLGLVSWAHGQANPNDCGACDVTEFSLTGDGETCPVDNADDTFNGGCNSDDFNPAGQQIKPGAFAVLSVPSNGNTVTICGTGSTFDFSPSCGQFATPEDCNTDADCTVGICVNDPDPTDGLLEGACTNCNSDADCPLGNCYYDPDDQNGILEGWCDEKIHSDCAGCAYDCRVGVGENDGIVGITDLFQLFGDWTVPDTPCDLNPNDVGAGINDLFDMFGSWGPCTDLCAKTTFNTQERACTEELADRRDTDWYLVTNTDMVAADTDGNGAVQIHSVVAAEFPAISFYVTLGTDATACASGVSVLSPTANSSAGTCNSDGDCAVGVCFGDPDPGNGTAEGVCGGNCTAGAPGDPNDSSDSVLTTLISDHPHGIVVFVGTARPSGAGIFDGNECSIGQNDYTLVVNFDATFEGGNFLACGEPDLPSIDCTAPGDCAAPPSCTTDADCLGACVGGFCEACVNGGCWDDAGSCSIVGPGGTTCFVEQPGNCANPGAPMDYDCCSVTNPGTFTPREACPRPCNDNHNLPGCIDPACCKEVCASGLVLCCLNDWDNDCATAAVDLGCAPELGLPICMANGTDDTVDGFLEVCPDPRGHVAVVGFGLGAGDRYNPVGAGPVVLDTQPATSTQVTFVFVSDTHREPLSNNPSEDAVFPDDATLDGRLGLCTNGVTCDLDGTVLCEDGCPPFIIEDVNSVDTIPDRLTSNFNLTGTGVDLEFTLVQNLVGDTFTQTYTILNQGGATLDFELVRHVDWDMIWDTGDTAFDDIVGTTTNGSGLSRSTYSRDTGGASTAVVLSSPDDADALYYNAKAGIDPDGDPAMGVDCTATPNAAGCGPQMGFGTDTQQWDEFGVPRGWDNYTPTIGAGVNGESGPFPVDATGNDCTNHAANCDASHGLEVEISLANGGTTTVTYVHKYGATVPDA